MTTTPAPTIAPEPLAIDVIVEYLGKGDSLSADLWKYCTNQWETLYFAFDPENYFYELNQNAITEPDDEDGDGVADSDPVDIENDPAAAVDIDDEDEGLAEMPETESQDTLTPEQREQLAIYAPYIRALKEFWGSMIVFTEDNPTVPDWNSMLESITKYIAFVPVDRDRLIRHVQRLNSARMEAESLRPRTHGVQQGTALFDIRNHQFK